MKNDLEKIIKKLESINEKLEEKDWCGPIPYIEEAIERLRDAIEDLETY